MPSPLRQTPLHATHVRRGAKVVPFAGWAMPVQFRGILAESRAVRSSAGIFDVSHMDRILISGNDAQALVDWVHTADIGEQMPVGRARYGLLCDEAGGILDDGIVYRLARERFLLVANAANADTVRAWLTRWRDDLAFQAVIEVATEETAMLALQGPHALEVFRQVADFDPAALLPFRAVKVPIRFGGQILVARTGYTGEDGVEVVSPAGSAQELWEVCMEWGATPCGLGARDLLRLEAGLVLHGADIDVTVNPVEAGLERFIARERDFCGSEPVRRALAQRPARRLVGFVTAARGPVPRAGSPLLAEGERVGFATSGAYSPSLDRALGLGYVPSRFAASGTSLQAEVRGNRVDATVTPLPFYKRPR